MPVTQEVLVGWLPPAWNANIASVRLRCMNPVRQLREEGFAAELFSWRRARRYRLLVLSKRSDWRALKTASWLKRRGCRIVFDLCDNHFLWPSRASRLRQVIACSDHVVAASESLREVIRAECPDGPPVSVIGDPVEDTVSAPSSWVSRLYHQAEARALARRLADLERRGVTPLLWYGNHGSPYAEGGMSDLCAIQSQLERAHERHPISLTVISNSHRTFRAVLGGWRIPSIYASWHPSTFLELLRMHRIAVIPATDNPFTRCKTNNRVALALHHGLGVIADPVPSYKPFSSCSFQGQWDTGLAAYLNDEDLRHAHVRAAQQIIQQSWTLQSIASQWRMLFERLAPRAAGFSKPASARSSGS